MVFCASSFSTLAMPSRTASSPSNATINQQIIYTSTWQLRRDLACTAQIHVQCTWKSDYQFSSYKSDLEIVMWYLLFVVSWWCCCWGIQHCRTNVMALLSSSSQPPDRMESRSWRPPPAINSSWVETAYDSVCVCVCVNVCVCIYICIYMYMCVCVWTKLHSNRLYPLGHGHWFVYIQAICTHTQLLRVQHTCMLTPVFCDHAQAHDYAELGVAIKSLPLQQLQ